MLLNGDLSIRTVVHADRLNWAPSPALGVERRLLFRIGDEKARATSIVRYATGSRFAHHSHPGGEEFLVLNGTFQDETGDFPAGTYVRNPPGSSHTPRSDEGCVIFVKLWQFRADDSERIVRRPGEGRRASLHPGMASSLVLFDGANERVAVEQWKAGAEIQLSNATGLELLVLDGAFRDDRNELVRFSWLRLPAGEALQARAGPDGVRVWYKLAPLLHEQVCAFEDASLSEKASG